MESPEIRGHLFTKVLDDNNKKILNFESSKNSIFFLTKY